MQADQLKAVPYAFLPAVTGTPRGSTAQRVHTVLREAIVGLELAPGADLDKQALCQRLGVSRFPVSEALGRLQAEGLVEILPQRGTRVARIRLSDVRQCSFIRRALEPQVARAIAAHAGAELKEALQRNLRYQQAAVTADDTPGFHALDLEFHAMLLDALGYPLATGMVDTARSSLDRIRRLLAPRRLTDTLGEHRRVAEAICTGDGEAAGKAMEAHLDAVTAQIDALVAADPTLFNGP